MHLKFTFNVSTYMDVELFELFLFDKGFFQDYEFCRTTQTSFVFRIWKFTLLSSPSELRRFVSLDISSTNDHSDQYPQTQDWVRHERPKRPRKGERHYDLTEPSTVREFQHWPEQHDGPHGERERPSLMTLKHPRTRR